jgi:hypothetical protein
VKFWNPSLRQLNTSFGTSTQLNNPHKDND